MEHVLNTLESKLSETAMNTPTPVALRTGHIDYSLELFETFGNEEIEQSKVQILQRLATKDFLTCSDFAAACKKAAERADEKDKMCGFTPAPQAKGVDLYGPTRKVLNQRLSEAKQIFGVFRLNPDALKEMGYWKALANAREYLKEAQIKWNATKIDAPEVKAAKKESKESMQAITEMMATWPQLPGENRKDYLERIDSKAEEALKKLHQEKMSEKINKVVESLAEKYDGQFLCAVADELLIRFDNAAIEAEMVKEANE